ncbi:TPA: DUF551 domain-containing protein [Escherichia coli]
MSKIDYQALREAAERAIPAMERLLMLPVDDDLLSEQELKDYGVDIDALNAFKFLTGPENVLALLDELDKWKQESSAWQVVAGKQLALATNAEQKIAELESLTAPKLPQPAPVSVPEVVGWEDVPEEITEDDIALASAWAIGFNQCRAAMLKLLCNSEQLDEVGSWNNHRNTPTAQDGNHTEQNLDMVDHFGDATKKAMLHGAEPVSQTYKLPVNTPCQDAPAHIWLQTAGVWPEDGELSELTWCSHNQHHDDTLYVRADLVNGNYPVTPDGWISCSDLMPEDTKMLLAFSQGEIVAAYWNWVVNPIDYKKYRAFTYLSGNILDDVTHWMPLPEPPQEVNRG